MKKPGTTCKRFLKLNEREKLSNAEQIYYYVNNYNNWNDFSM